MGRYSKYSDADLSNLLKAGDHAAFTEIYDRYMGILYLHALKMVKDELEAEDVIHELFTTLWLKATELNVNTTLSAYLYRAVKNKVLNIFSHRKIEGAYLNSLQEYIDAGSWNTDELVQARELALLIENEVAKLPEKMRLVFELSRNAGLSHKEIAEQLNISDKTVKKQINNAIKLLKGKIDRLSIFFL